MWHVKWITCKSSIYAFDQCLFEVIEAIGATAGGGPPEFLRALADPHGVQSVQPAAERTLTSQKLLYELLSIVVHHGGPQSGHYTVYRKVRLPKDADPEVRTADEDEASLLCNTEVREHSKETETISSVVPKELQADCREAMERDNAGDRESVVWFKISDTNVRRVEEWEVQLANASLLFYERLRSNS